MGAIAFDDDVMSRELTHEDVVRVVEAELDRDHVTFVYDATHSNTWQRIYFQLMGRFPAGPADSGWDDVLYGTFNALPIALNFVKQRH